MYCVDFIFDGEKLSDHNFMICNFEGEQTSMSGGNVIFTTIKPPHSNINTFYASGFEEPLTFTFSICKNTCNSETAYVSQNEQSEIMRWLQRVDGYHWLSFCQDGWEDIAFHAQLNMQPYFIDGKCAGYSVTVNTDSPYGYSQPEIKEFELQPDDTFSIVDYSDIVGYNYPHVEITILSDGDLGLETGCADYQKITRIENVKTNDIITLDRDNDVIDGIPNLNHFNFVFPVISNSYDTTKNGMTNIGSAGFKIKMRYRYIRRVQV